MKERPILFSAPMVRAILDGTKTQTRRIVKPQPTIVTSTLDGVTQVMRWKDKINTPLVIGPDCLRSLCPYGKPGDTLWVRETWARPHPEEGVIYRATDPSWDDNDASPGWKPSIHMPRAYSRIGLEITAVRVERLQDISEAAARAEGVTLDVGRRRAEAEAYNKQYPRTPVPVGWAIVQRPDDTHRNGFAALWNQINGKAASWESDPWVWVLEFRRMR